MPKGVCYTELGKTYYYNHMKPRIIKKTFSLLLLLLLLGCAPSNYSHIKVSEVIDGDTIKLSNGKLLRYIGIDTPEMRTKKGKEFIYSPQPYSLEAKEFNRQLVEGKFVRIEFDVEKHDRYARVLGYCFVNDVFVNAEMIEEGMEGMYITNKNSLLFKENKLRYKSIMEK